MLVEEDWRKLEQVLRIEVLKEFSFLSGSGYVLQNVEGGISGWQQKWLRVSSLEDMLRCSMDKNMKLPWKYGP